MVTRDMLVMLVSDVLRIYNRGMVTSSFEEVRSGCSCVIRIDCCHEGSLRRLGFSTYAVSSLAGSMRVRKRRTVILPENLGAC